MHLSSGSFINIYLGKLGYKICNSLAASVTSRNRVVIYLLPYVTAGEIQDIPLPKENKCTQIHKRKRKYE